MTVYHNMPELPDFERFVIAGGHEESAVGGPGHVRDAQLVAGDGLLKLAIIRSPNLTKMGRY